MRSDVGLAGVFCLGLLSGNVALGSQPLDPASLALLCGLIVVSDLLALPVPKRGFLSNSFIWAFVLAQLSGPAIAAVTVTFSLVLRFAILGKGAIQCRAVHLLSELSPALLSLCLLELTRGQASHGFAAGYLATGLSLGAYYLTGRGCLKHFYSSPSESSFQLLKGATQSRELQFRITTMFSPAATLLSSGELMGVLWLVPVLLATHQFFWERLLELGKVLAEGEQRKAKLEQTESALEIQSKNLDLTKSDRDLIQRCLEVFSNSADLEQTGRRILELLTGIVRARQYALFWESERGFGPLLALDAGHQSLHLSPDSFSDLALLQRCYQTKKIVSGQSQRCWCFPLYERGVLYLGDVNRPPTEEQKRSLTVLTRQSTFGLRSALLFEQLSQTVEQEKQARAQAEKARQEAVQARDELEVAQAQLLQSSKMAAVGQLAAGVAHELNSPLAAVLLAIQAGRRSLKKGNYEKALERFDKCEEATTRAKHIVDGLLTRSRKSESETALTPLSEVTAQTVEFLGERLGHQGTRVITDCKEEMQAVVNPDEVSQILTNLILNSHQALGKRGNGDGIVRVTLERQDESAVISVSDNGPGIPSDARDRIFEPFFTTKTQGEGTGLGLYISSELAHKNKGELRLVSTGETGTVFALTFKNH